MKIAAAPIAVVVAWVCAAGLAARAAGASTAPGSRNMVVVTTTADVLNGNTSSIAALNRKPGRGGISLRDALLAADHTGGSATVYILFSPRLNGRAIDLHSPLPSIHRDHLTLEGIAPNGSPAQVTLDGSHAPSSATSWLLTVQASNVTVRWLRFTGLHGQGNPTGRMIGLIVNAGRWGGPACPDCPAPSFGPPAIAHVQILDDVFDNSNGNRSSHAQEIGAIVGSGGNVGGNTHYSDITVARNTFLDYHEDDSLGVWADATHVSMSGIAIRDNTFEQALIPIEMAEGGVAPLQTGIQIVGNTIAGGGWPEEGGIYLTAGSNVTSGVPDNTLIEDNAISGTQTAALNVGRDAQIINNVISTSSIALAGIGITGGNVTVENDTLVDSESGTLLSASPTAGAPVTSPSVTRFSTLRPASSRSSHQTRAPILLTARTCSRTH